MTLIHFLLSRLLIDTKLLERRSKSQELPQLKRNPSVTVIPNPFDFCPSYSPGDKIGAKYGTVTLLKGRMHLVGIWAVPRGFRGC